MNETLDTRVAVLEAQVGRITSDIESEKGTRARANSEIMETLKDIVRDQRKMEKIIYGGLGGLAALQFIIPLLFKK